MQVEKFKGLIAAPHTPMNADGSINLTAIEKQAELLAKNGLAGVYVCGTTGEGTSLSLDERKQVVHRWLQVADSRLKVMVNVGHTCLESCRMLAQDAAQAGAFAISAMPSYYYKPACAADLVDFYAGIVSAAPEMPFYAYHTLMIPVPFSVCDFLRAASGRIPTLAGVKFNSTDMTDFIESTNFDPERYDVLFGVDEYLLASLAYGARAAIGSTYNYSAPLYKRLIDAFDAGNMETARAIQLKSVKMVNILCKYGSLAAGKAVMKLVGVDCGPVRPPVTRLTDQDFASLCEQLYAIGFEEFYSLKV
ncbi:MAG: dihydrodipicolinate synthase family protein [Planctomycetota bacterium]|jgi:N-acetylneuraminate lyase